MLPTSVPSPLTNEPSALVKRLDTAPIMEGYRKEFGYDAAETFEGIPEVGLYECPTTSVRFYYPFETAGKESLYRQLETFEWNYKDEKWEHDVSVKLVKRGDKVLDIGCGEGSFLARAAQAGAISTGIELNKSAAAKAAGKGVEVRSEMLDAHALERSAYYDIVTAFQVLEHVINPGEFLRQALQVLKPGGLLIIGVPNDESFVGMDDRALLNGPPHHMTLWTRVSLERAAGLFPMTLQSIDREPLLELGWYQHVMERRYLTSWWQRKLYYWSGMNRSFSAFIEDNRLSIAGHTILAVYRKDAA